MLSAICYLLSILPHQEVYCMFVTFTSQDTWILGVLRQMQKLHSCLAVSVLMKRLTLKFIDTNKMNGLDHFFHTCSLDSLHQTSLHIQPISLLHSLFESSVAYLQNTNLKIFSKKSNLAPRIKASFNKFFCCLDLH